MARKQRTWEIDWAGPHGTAWGTVNTCWTVATVAWLGHLAEIRVFDLPAGFVALCAVGVGVLAVLWVLLRAAFRRRRTPVGTTMYHLACVTGATIWLTYVVAHRSWPWRWQLASVGALVAMAVVAGLIATLTSPEEEEPPVDPDMPRPTGDPDQDARNKLSVEWEARLDRLCGTAGTPEEIRKDKNKGWQVPGIEMWPRGNGYTVEAIAPQGGATWRNADAQKTALYGDLDLVFGGMLTVAMGVSQRAALIEVTTSDILAEDTFYPEDRPVHSINDDLQVGHQDDGNLMGPNLRQNCMQIAGEAGSGKTNASHCYTAEIATTNDAVEWKWELTGGGFWAPWMQPWLDGECVNPPVDWCAFDGKELRWMTRAALRVGHTRKPGYRQLMLDADDDKVPVSPAIPEIIVSGDEIAKVTGALTEHQEAKENLKLITYELRAAGVRTIFYALRGTDDVIANGIQSQCQVRGVMRIANKAEANWVFGTGCDFGPDDTPYPGSGGLSLGSGQQPIRMKYHRMKPSTIRRIAILASPRRPKLDELSRLAANGRHPDTTPMQDLEPGELDCYDRRWKRFFEHYGYKVIEGATVSDAHAVTPGASVPQPEGAATATAVLSQDEALKEMEQAMAALDKAAGQARAARMDDGGKLTDDDNAMFLALVEQMKSEGFGDDEWGEEGTEQAETAPQPGDEAILLELLRAAGPGGIKPKVLREQLAARGVEVSRDTLHKRLNALRDVEPPEVPKAHQPRYGKWAAGPKP